MTTIGVTGHRPQRLGGHDLKTRRALGAFAIEILFERHPDHVITGMALGWDQAVATTCVVLGIPFTAAVPCIGQESRWDERQQARYRYLLSLAADVEVVSEQYSDRAMQRRNEWIVDRSAEMLALWDGNVGGGTANCIGYAESRGVLVTNLWTRWLNGVDPIDLMLG